ncbi:MAG: hypothetical protein R3F59_26740 [Myxococcota bacterium]
MTHLEQILVRLRDGETSPDLVARAIALVRADERIPDDVREVAFGDPTEAAEDAAGLLAVLGADDLGDLLVSAVMAAAGEPPVPHEVPHEGDDDAWAPIGACLVAGLRAEAEGFEVAHAVMRRALAGGAAVDFAWGPVIAEAVAQEAGQVEVAGAVHAVLGAPALAPVAAAVLAHAGSVDVSGAVLAELGHERGLDVAAAVRAEAGSVDVAEAVLFRLGFGALPAPANDARGWSFAGLALAAAALLSVVVSRLVVPVGVGPVPSEALVFAQAGDVVVEDLSYADDVVVFQTEGEQGVVILWLDEEA